MKLTFILPFLFGTLIFISCKKTDDSSNNTGPKINFIFKFDSTQIRLNGLGAPVTVPVGHGAQSPKFNSMSAHYVELAPTAFTLLGNGAVLYKAPETVGGGVNAIDFSKSTFAGDNQVFLSVPLTSLAAGNYNYLRVSLAYQNYNIKVTVPSISGLPAQTIDATLASFIGFNSYITNFKVKDSTVQVNTNKKQGYWAFESSISGYGFVSTGQAPPGATTVPNPLAASSPIPAGSCVVTGQFTSPLIITGAETNDINIEVSLSTNKSFEWTETDGNNKYEPLAPNNEQVIDMGIRGMIPRKL